MLNKIARNKRLLINRIFTPTAFGKYVCDMYEYEEEDKVCRSCHQKKYCKRITEGIKLDELSK